ncbi:dihydroorotase family protein, partial [Pseudomonadota bacterium]
FCRISTSKAAQMIARAQYDGLPVTMDVCAHQLYLTDMDVGEFDSQCHARPPLRSQRDMIGLQEALARGTISAICSDHQPHERDAKLRPFRESASGISGLETLLSLTLRLAEDGKLSLTDAINRVTYGPARILGINAGTLDEGRAADIIVVDPEQYWTVSENNLKSNGKNTPFMGWDLKGVVEHTVVDGKLVYSINEN